MSIQAIGLKAYSNALNNFVKAERTTQMDRMPDNKPVKEFTDVLSSSLGKVNELQSQRSDMVAAFASGETQNVHELMIAMQKAGLAMNMTSAVRNKVLDAYRELSRIQF